MTTDRSTFDKTRQEFVIICVKQAACARFRVSLDDLVGPKRFPTIAWARHSAMLVIRRICGASYPDLARAFLKKDHNSAIYSVQVAEARMRHQPDYAKKMECLKREAEALIAANPEKGGRP